MAFSYNAPKVAEGFEGERPRRELTSGQNQSPHEGGSDYSAMLSYIRANQDKETFVTDLRDNKKRLQTMVKDIFDAVDASHSRASIEVLLRPQYTRAVAKEIFDDSQGMLNREEAPKLVAAEYLKFVLEQHVFDRKPYILLDPELDHDEIDEMRASVEAKEKYWSKFVKSVASGWLETHPASEAAKAVSMLGFYALPDQHQRLLQETWPHLLPVLTARSEKKV